MEVRNFIVLGLSQHGKTTFMNGLLAMQNVSAERRAVGNGTERCDVSSTLVHLHPPGQPTQILQYTRLPRPELPEGHLEGEELNARRRDYWADLLEDRDFKADIQFSEPLRVGRGLVDGSNIGLVRWGAGSTFQIAAAVMVSTGSVVAAAAAVAGAAQAAAAAVTHWGSSQNTSEPQAPVAEMQTQDPPPQDHPSEHRAEGVEATPQRCRAITEDPPPQDPMAPAIQICALDTPGVEDSKGEDDAHVENIIETVLELETLSGLAMVTKCGHPITPAWKAQVKRYWDLFPMMRGQWIFIHTNADPCAINSPSRVETSSFEEHVEARSRFVDEAMRELTGEASFGAAHLFVESNVKPMRRVGEALSSFLAEQHNMLYSLVANFSPVHISDLPFRKGPKLLAIDEALVSALDATTDAITSTLAEYNQEIGELVKLRNRHHDERAVLEKQVTEIKLLLQTIDHDGFEEVVAYPQKTWEWIGYARASSTLQAKHHDYTVTIYDVNGYQQTYLSEEREKRVVELSSGGLPKITIHVVVKWIWTNLAAKIVVRSPSRLVHRERIVVQKTKLDNLEEKLTMLSDAQAQQEKMLKLKKTAEGFTLKRQRTAHAAKTFLHAAWSVEVWRAMKPFYEACSASTEAKVLMAKFYETWMAWRTASAQPPLGFETVPIALDAD
mmetsp:Transcript_8880/g.24279  ORF Transcript_8880/g.24279 Transcript_8880/m.24279 type:complete len:669 (+) Transcript_8880:81-2087(+)